MKIHCSLVDPRLPPTCTNPPGPLPCYSPQQEPAPLSAREQAANIKMEEEAVSLTKLETQFSQLDFNAHQRPGDVASLAIKAYLGLTKLCTPLHGAEAGAVGGVLRALIPSILMVGEGTNKSLQVIRAHSLR